MTNMILGTISCLQIPIFGESSKGSLCQLENSSFSPRHGLIRQFPHTMSTSCYCRILGSVSHTAFHCKNSLNPGATDGLPRIPQKFRIPKGIPLFRGSKSSNFDYGKENEVSALSSSFAEPDGEDIERNYFNNEEKKDCKMSSISSGLENGKVQNKKVQGMSEAFNISPRTAFGISGGIALAALVLPLLMKSLGHGLPMKTKSLSYLTLLFGFYMAWNIGANDVANAMGTSVGSGALTLRQAVVTAGFLEFSGAFLMGSHVSSTMQKGILVANVFSGKDSLLFAGMLSSLASAGTWLQVASYYGWPVSTTHCIIGAMVGFGLVYGGVGAVFWRSLARVVSSWVISPLLGAAVSFVVYKCIRTFVYSAPNPGQAAAAAAPIAVFLGVAGLSFIAFPLSVVPWIAAAQALGCGILGALLITKVIQQQLGNLLESSKDPQSNERGIRRRVNLLSEIAGPKGDDLTIVYSIFGYLQVLSACFMSFAHGANDVANAIGPITAALSILQGTHLNGNIFVPIDVLAWGGFGIVSGLMIWGYKVMATIGKKITELTPTRGFAAEFAAATVVVIASKLGLPISATHTLVGAVMGVGFARGLNNVRVETVREIVASWAVTIPIGAVLSVIYSWILIKLIPSLI